MAKKLWRARRKFEQRMAGADRPDTQMAQWYANLEIPYGSDLDTVNRARKRLLSKYHPDRFATDPERARQAGELTLVINQAHAGLVKRLSE